MPRREIGRDGVEALLVKRTRLLGGHSIKLAPMQAGIPDRLVMFPKGQIYLVEVKAEDGTLDPAQKHWHEKLLEDQGITVHVLWGERGVIEFLRMAYERSLPHRPRQYRRGRKSGDVSSDATDPANVA